MHVGLDYRPGLQNREGIGRYTRELVLALAALEDGPRLSLYGSTFARPRVPHGLPPGVHMRRWRLPTRAQHALLGALSGADGFLGGPDVFHHTQYHRLPVARAAEVATLHDCIYATHPEFVSRDAAAGMEGRARTLATAARVILAPSEFAAAELARHFDVDPGRVRVTPLGCDHVAGPERSAAPGGEVAPPTPPYVLTLGRVEPRKNHARMLAAFEGLVAEGLPHRWRIAGPRGHDAGAFLDELAQSPARERVDWLGEVDEPSLAEHLAGADIFLFTSLAEGFGLPPLEAMAAGVPTVTSCTTSLGEVCRGGARLVDPLDVDATRAALCELAGDRAERERWAGAARQRAATFTWRRCAELTLDAYREALA